MEPRALGDGVIVRRSIAEPELFTVIFDRYYLPVHRFVCQRVGGSVADDVAAETFVRAFERRSSYDTSVERALPWLLGIAVNLVAHHRRSEARQLRALASLAAAEPGPDGDVRLDSRRLSARLIAGLERLDNYDRDVVLLYAWGELSYEEIGQALAIPVGTVRSRLNRARRKLRDALADDDAANVVQLRERGMRSA